MNIEKKNVLWRFIVTAIISLLIPFLGNSFFTYHLFMQEINEINIEKNYIATKQKLERYINEIEKIAEINTRIYNTAELNPKTLAKNSYRLNIGRIKMNELILNLDSVKDILLMPQKSEYVISTHSSYPYDSILKVMGITDKEKLFMEIEDLVIKYPYLWIGEAIEGKTGEILIPCITQIYYPIEQRAMPCIYFINSKVIEEQLLITDKSIVQIYDYYDRLIYSNDLAFSVQGLEEQNTIVNIGENKYLRTLCEEEKFGFKIIEFMPYEIYSKGLSEIQGSSLAIIIIFFIVATILMGIMILLNYRPWQAIKSVLNREKNEKESYANKLKDITQSLSEMEESYLEARGELEKNLKIIKKYSIQALLNGNFSEEQDLTEELEQVKIQFLYKYYTAIIIRNARLKQIELLEKMMVYSYETAEEIHILLNYNEQQLLEVYIKNIVEAINWNNDVVIGIGGMVTQVNDIHFSHEQALSCLSAKKIIIEEKLIYYTDLVKNKQMTEYPNERINKIIKGVNEGNIGDIQGEVEALVEMLRAKQVSVQFVKLVYYDLINLVLRKIVLPHKSFEQTIYLELEYLLEQESFGALSEHLLKLTQKIQQEWEIKDDNKDLFNKIKQYIDESYLSPSFSLQNTALQFKITPQYISILFKNNIQDTAINYINQKKMDKAQELLIQTEGTIRDIVGYLGYVDSSSFIKKFKKHTGVTPNEFRKLYK